MKKCECGCGQTVNNRFVHGHYKGRRALPDKNIVEFRKECEELHRLIKEKKRKDDAIKRLRKDN